MIHDLLHFFRERNQPNLTLVVVKFNNGQRNIQYRERLNLVSAFVPQRRFLYLCCLLWFDSSVLLRRIHRTVLWFTNTFELFHPKTSTELPSQNRTRYKKLANLYECLRLAFSGHKCLSRDVMGSHAKVPTN